MFEFYFLSRAIYKECAIWLHKAQFFMASGSGLVVGGRAQNTSSMYVGSNPSSASLQQTPATVNQTLGFQSNQTIPYHWTIARWTNNLDKSIMNGQIVFLKCSNDIPLLRNRAYTMLNLPMVNYALYRDCLDTNRSDQVSGNTTTSEQELETILKTYRPMGSVINDVNGDTDPSNTADRVINVAIAGRQTTFNVFGDIHDGDYLYLKLEKVEVKGTNFNLSVKQHSQRQDEQQTVQCYQWIPCTCSSTCRWKAESSNPNNQLAPTHCIEIGRVFRCPRGKNYSLSKTKKLHLVQNLSDMVSKTYLFEIHWNINA